MLGEAMTRLGFTGYACSSTTASCWQASPEAPALRPSRQARYIAPWTSWTRSGRRACARRWSSNGVPEEVAARAVDLFLMGKEVKSFSDNAALLSELAGPLKDDRGGHGGPGGAAQDIRGAFEHEPGPRPLQARRRAGARPRLLHGRDLRDHGGRAEDRGAGRRGALRQADVALLRDATCPPPA